jgi:hypothetical protein
MKRKPRRVFAIVAFAAVFVLVLSLDTGQAAAQATVVCSNSNFGTVVLDSQFGGPGPLAFAIQGTCILNLIIMRDDVTLTTNGVNPAVFMAADPNQSTIRIEGRRVVIDGLFANGFTVSGGTFGISVRRGGSADIRNCQVTGASNTGIISSYNSDITVDGCSVTGNGTGISTVNTAAAVVTNSTVSGNTSNGLVASRNAYLRVGQDQAGTVVVKPVTVSGNGGTGIAITEGSAGNIVGGTVETSASNNIFVGRASSGQIGTGTNNLTGGVTVRNASSHGIVVEGGNATIAFSTITGNAARGVTLSNGAAARIGVTNTNSVFGANTINSNGTDGIGVFHSAAAFIGGNTINANAAFGVNVGGATADLIGGNNITSTVTGVLTGVTGTAGQSSGCNVFP